MTGPRKWHGCHLEKLRDGETGRAGTFRSGLAVLGKVCDSGCLSANSLRGLCNPTHVRPMAGRRHYVQGSGLKVLCPCVRGLQTSGRQAPDGNPEEMSCTPRARASAEMPKQINDTKIADEAPWSNELTSYDEAQLVTYLRLLDASAEGASDDEMAKIILGIDPATEPERAKRALASHLRRARWMTEAGYQHLLQH